MGWIPLGGYVRMLDETESEVPAHERDRRIDLALDMVRMTEYKDRYPRQLSGGQQQRVAIARALAIEP